MLKFVNKNNFIISLPGKILERCLHYAYQLVDRDSLTGAKIHRRKDLVKIGSDYGGWVIPTSLISEDSICYCAGCGEDISFDLGLIEHFNCEIYAFDPTPRAIHHIKITAGKNPKYHFKEIGLWDKKDTLNFYAPENSDHVSHSLLNLQKTEKYISVNVDRLSALANELGHDHIDLLKIDIEGAEYKVLESIIEDNLEIKVLCIEYDECFHSLDNDYKMRIKKSVESLLAQGFRLIYSEGRGNYTFIKQD